ncbi:hypothetical protein [Mesoplasma lactucae]|uniref:Uncharacterized protein n=1 Tax=Mesoplasma lactucae ATCC 49193 TaxID=81460 RepID=A0A291IS28_9MOLU|nr:hypothetical protein [Mesoplasma lactucae]ATG97497.1 hypothetical protein CP520_01885 [Mesoplasma lactucae ATCC 49193]ATZ20047.1 hypothetical protein MLACT_v1c02250 [Mesoplasma lactucae ATCC 49193]MCL8217002.1 hypothetical protein [Mesoplasma lactucae ATCC 49193]
MKKKLAIFFAIAFIPALTSPISSCSKQTISSENTEINNLISKNINKNTNLNLPLDTKMSTISDASTVFRLSNKILENIINNLSEEQNKIFKDYFVSNAVLAWTNLEKDGVYSMDDTISEAIDKTGGPSYKSNDDYGFRIWIKRGKDSSGKIIKEFNYWLCKIPRNQSL